MSEESKIDYLEIDESSEEYEIDKLDPGEERTIAIWHKHLSRYVARSKFWESRLNVGKKCMNFMRRDIFTGAQRYKYLNVDNKWPIESQEMKPVMNALAHQIMHSAPGADITYEDENPPETAAKPEVMQTVLTWLKQQIKLQRRQRKVLKDGLITGFPGCLWFDTIRGVASVPGGIPLKPTVLPWDSALPSEWFREDDGSDIDEVMVIKQMTKAELLKTFPNRRASFEKHEDLIKNDAGYQEKLLHMDKTHGAADRRSLIYDMVTSSRFDSTGGRYFVIQDVYPVTNMRRAWINEDTMDVFIPPPDWPEWQRDQWLEDNPEYSISDELELTTLWVTTISSDGFVWENAEHWYQEGDAELPCVFYVADMVDNLPTGAGEDMLPYILAIAACDTEGLSQVRKGTGRTTFIAEGSTKHPGRLNSELSKEEGLVILKKGHNPRDAVTTQVRTPNDSYFRMADRLREQLGNVHRINETIMGATSPRQSDKAKQTEIAQGLAPQGPYVENYTNFILNCENLLCKMVPRVLTEQMIINIKDEWGQPQEPVEINQVGFDYAGEAKLVANDLISARYRAIPAIGDDSKTSREKQAAEFTHLLESIGNQLFQLAPELLGKILSTFPNRYAREASQFLFEQGERNAQAQQQAAQAEMQKEAQRQGQRKEIELEKIRRPKIAFKLGAKDIQEAPEGAKILYEMMKAGEAEQEQKEMEKQEQEAMAEQQAMAAQQ